IYNLSSARPEERIPHFQIPYDKVEIPPIGKKVFPIEPKEREDFLTSLEKLDTQGPATIEPESDDPKEESERRRAWRAKQERQRQRELELAKPERTAWEYLEAAPIIH